MKTAASGHGRLIDAGALSERIRALEYLSRRDKELFISEVLAEPAVETREPAPGKTGKRKNRERRET